MVHLDSWQTDGIFKTAAFNSTSFRVRCLRCEYCLERASRNVEAISKNFKERILDLLNEKMMFKLRSFEDLKTENTIPQKRLSESRSPGQDFRYWVSPGPEIHWME